MKRFITSLALAAGIAAAATAFTPEPGVQYCLRHVGTDLVLGSNDKNNAVLQTPVKTAKAAYELSFVADGGDGAYKITNGLGQYMYWEGYSVSFTDAYNSSKGNNYAYTFIDTDTEGQVRLGRGYNSDQCVAPDNLADGAGVYSDKALDFGNGVYEVFKASELTYEPKIKLGVTPVQIMHDSDEAANSEKFTFSPVNFSGEVTLTASDGFSVEPATLTVTDGEAAEVVVSSSAAIGTEGTLSISYDGNVLAEAALMVIEPAPYFYLINLETQYVIGGETTKAVLCENSRSDDVMFRQIPVPGKNGFYYYIQKSSGLYFRNVDSGNGVGAHYCEFGESADRAEWTTWEADGGVILKNSKQDRILVPTSLSNPLGAQLMCYGLSSDAGAVWQLINVDDMPEEAPMIEIADENVLVEQDGMSFTTQVRAMYLDGGYVTVVPSDGVYVSTNSIEDSFKRSDLTISTSRPEGSQCSVKFFYGNELLKTLSFTVAPRFNRYVIMHNGDAEPLALGTADADSEQACFVAYDMSDPLQQFIVMPAGDQYYLVQEQTFRFLGRSGGWDCSLAPGLDNLWTLDGFAEDLSSVAIKSSKGTLDADQYEVGAKVYTNKGKGTWTFNVVGQINVLPAEVILETATSTATVAVTGAGLSEAIAVTTDGAARVAETSLPAQGGNLTVSLAGGNEGTVTLTSGRFKRTFTVRLKTVSLNVSAPAVSIVGKGASATFTVTASDIAEPITLTASEGFTVSPATIEAAAQVEKNVVVKYTGKVAAEGTVTLSCGDMSATVTVNASFNPDITVDTEGFVFDEGIAYLIVTPVDLFDNVAVSASAPLDIEPEYIEPDRKEEYVFFSANEQTPGGNIEVKLTAPSVVKTYTITYTDGVAECKQAVTIAAHDGIIELSGAAAGTRLCVTDLAGRTVADTCSGSAAVAPGIYVVRGAGITAKILCK